LWYARTHGGPLGHPAALVLRHDAEGRPFVFPLPLGATTDVVPEGEGQGDEQLPCVSLSHTEGAAIALASAEPVGVDMEALGRVSQELLAEFATAQEVAAVQRMAELHGDQAWETRLWCAKEAAAKLAGTGLKGRPANFQAVDIEASGRFLMLDVATAQRRWVTTSATDRFVIACAFASQSASVASPPAAGPVGSDIPGEWDAAGTVAGGEPE
jgi:phosphopantetheinyl transferase (holo-ACP synthase)